MIDVAQATSTTMQVQFVDPILMKVAIAAASLIAVVGGWLVKLLLTLSHKTDAFFVTWYGDPNATSGPPNGAKNKLYQIGTDVSALKEWSRGYDRALSALAQDNENLRSEWQPGDPDRREKQR